jgi:peptidoglycan/xylan/chitin deacetylase (PgdA/CDA1 family)
MKRGLRAGQLISFRFIIKIINTYIFIYIIIIIQSPVEWGHPMKANLRHAFLISSIVILGLTIAGSYYTIYHDDKKIARDLSNYGSDAITIGTYNTLTHGSYDQAPDFMCDGNDDQDKIQAAIDKSDGRPVVLLDGNYIKSSPEGIKVPSNATIVLSPGATIQLKDHLDSDACIFRNADEQGDQDIRITGGGTLDGNEPNQASGAQYGIIFNNVKNTAVDLIIKSFRNFDVKDNNSYNVTISNRYYGSEWNSATSIYPEMATNKGPGRKTLTIHFAKPVDLRNKAITIRTNFNCIDYINYTSRGVEKTYKTVTGESLQENYGSDLSVIKKIKVAPDLETEGSDSGLAAVDGIEFVQWVPSGTTLDWGDVWLEPLPDEPLVTLCFDDGGDEFCDVFAPILKKYGYKGVACLVSTYSSSVDKYNKLYYDYGWDIASHSYTHLEMNSISRQRIWEEMVNSRRWIDKNGWTRGADVFTYPQNGANYWDYEAASAIYTITRGVSRYDDAVNPLTRNIMTYQGDRDVNKALMRAKKAHSWEIITFHKNDNSSFVEQVCKQLKENGLKVVTFSEELPEQNVSTNTDWKNNISTDGTFIMHAGEQKATLDVNLPVQPNNITLSYDKSICQLAGDEGKVNYQGDQIALIYNDTMDELTVDYGKNGGDFTDGELIGVGDGNKTFLHALMNKPVVPGSLEIHFSINGKYYGTVNTGCIYDDAQGTLEGYHAGAGGKIDYDSGVVYLAFDTPPDGGVNITAHYRYPITIRSNIVLPEDMVVRYHAEI